MIAACYLITGPGNGGGMIAACYLVAGSSSCHDCFVSSFSISLNLNGGKSITGESLRDLGSGLP